MYGYRIGIHNAITDTKIIYCITDHWTMAEACTELKAHLKLKPEDRLTHTFHCIGYGAMWNTDVHVPATYEYVYVSEQDDRLP